MVNEAMRINIFLPVFLLASAVTAVAAEHPSETYRRALEAVKPYLVRIDTIGGHEKVGETLANEGATTGVLIDHEGRILTSAFNFLHDPSSILIRLPNGTRKVARKIATDRNRMLTLLQIDGIADTPSMPPAALPIRPITELRLGERVIAVGHAFSPDEPNIALGVLSGRERIWGKAIQTDAAVSPNNYGGPLIDLQGRVLGILTPLSMSAPGLAAGDELYDAGLGMAIPMGDVSKIVVPKLREGKDLEPGEIGIMFQDNTIFVGAPIVFDVLPDSPVAKAGLKKGDRIVKIGDAPVSTALAVVMAVRKSYAGDTFRITFRRDDREQTVTVNAVVREQRQPPEQKPAATLE